MGLPNWTVHQVSVRRFKSARVSSFLCVSVYHCICMLIEGRSHAGRMSGSRPTENSSSPALWTPSSVCGPPSLRKPSRPIRAIPTPSAPRLACPLLALLLLIRSDRFDVTPSFVTNVSSESGQTFVACGSEDGRIFLWDVQSRQVTASWQAHMDAVIGVAAHGNYIVSAGLEKDLVAKVWVNVAR